MHRKSLLWHLFLPFLAVIVLSLALITGYTSRALRDFYYDQKAEDLHDRARLLQEQVLRLLRTDDAARIQALCQQVGRASHMRLTIVLPDGTVVGDTEEQPQLMDNHAGRPEIVAALENGYGQSVRYSATLGHQRMYVAIPVLDDETEVGVVRTSQSLASVDRALRLVHQKIALGGLVLALIAGLISYGLARRISVPLRQMKEGAERFAQGHLATRIAATSDAEEIGALAEALNAMATQLADRISTVENQRQELQSVLGSMVEGVVAIDREETIIGWNEASNRLLGLTAEDATGRSIQEIVRNPDLISMAQMVLRGGETAEGDIVLLRDTERYLQIHATALHGSGGERLGALLVLNDVTRLRRLENLRRDFVANVSHELRTPITSIKGFVEALRDNPPQDPGEVARFHSIIARQADRLQAIIDDLLTLSRIEQETGPDSLSRREVDVCEMLRDVVAMCTARATADMPPVALECAADLHARVNAPLVEQAVANLVENALKYSGATEPIRVGARREGERLLIVVRDQGRGIAAEHLPRVFERFYRVDRARSRKLGGTGLGLAIVKHIAQAHGGEVTVTSEAGRGSTFTLNLPGGGDDGPDVEDRD